MITESQLLDAIATAILNKQDLYIDSYAGAAATTADFEYCAPYDSPAGYELLFSASEFIDDCIEADCEDGDYISERDVKNGWYGEADMPTWEQIRDFVSACDSNDNFAYTIECLKSEGYMED